MNYTSRVLCEFSKNAAWQNLPYKSQRRYLKRHPKSRFRPTALPGSEIERNRFYDVPIMILRARKPTALAVG